MLKVISWNMAHRPELWRTLRDADVDLALLQEACAPPEEVMQHLDIGETAWRTEGLKKRPWQTAIVPLNSELTVERIPTKALCEASASDFGVSQPRTIAAAYVTHPILHEKYLFISMYGLWENPHASTSSSWIYADAAVHRLISDMSQFIGREKGHRIIAAGDLNILHGYGEGSSSYWKARYRTIFDRFEAIGLRFVGPQHPNGRQAQPWPAELPLDSLNVPTFHTTHQKPETATRQLDFVFASAEIAERVKTYALNTVEQWGGSDHCRIRIDIQ